MGNFLMSSLDYDDSAKFSYGANFRVYQIHRKGECLFFSSSRSQKHERVFASTGEARAAFENFVKLKLQARLAYLDEQAHPGQPSMLVFPERHHGIFKPICAADHGDEFFISCFRGRSNEELIHISASGAKRVIGEVRGNNFDIWHTRAGLLMNRDRAVTLLDISNGQAVDLAPQQLHQSLYVAGNLAVWYDAPKLVIRNMANLRGPALASVPVALRRYDGVCQLAAAVSPKALAWCVNPEWIKIYHFADGSYRKILKSNSAHTIRMHLSADGSRVYVLDQGGFRGVRCYDTGTGNQIWECPDSEEMCFDPRGRRVAVCMSENATIRIYDLANHSLLESFRARYAARGASVTFTEKQLAVYTDTGIAGLYRLSS